MPAHLRSAPAGVLACLVVAGVLTMLGTRAPAAADEASAGAAMGALKLAKHYYDKKDFARAAARFHEAWSIDPNPAFLFNAARAEMRSFQLDAAEKHFRQYLGLKGIDAAGRRRAQVHVEEIAAQRKLLAAKRRPAPTAAPATAVVKTDAPDWMTIGLWAGSGVALVAAGGLYWSARSARDDTNKLVVNKEWELKDHNEQVEAQAMRRNIAVGAAVAGAGLAVWAWLNGSAAAGDAAAALQVAPWHDGRGLAMRTRF